MARDMELAVGAANAAVHDAGLVTRATDPEGTPTYPARRVGCQIGAGLVAADIEELTEAMWSSRRDDGTFDLAHWGHTGMQRLTPLWLLKYLPNMLACHVTIIHDCQGPSNTITCAEVSGMLSVGESVRVIQRGSADACLTGGVESKINPMGLLRQHFAGRVAPTADDQAPAAAVRPFDPDATGTVLGEGGGILIVETLDGARQRGATPYAEIIGFAATQSFCPDTVGTHPDPKGAGIADAIGLALAQAGLDATDIDAIVPYASGVPVVDQAEAAALLSVFGARLSSIPIVTITPNAGNCCAGAGALQVAVAARCLRDQHLPARLNTRGSSLDANATDARASALRAVLVTCTSLGGQNAAIILRRVDS
jgi:3-oxoacyl-[acyl-carrier-protein] synthase II